MFGKNRKRIEELEKDVDKLNIEILKLKNPPQYKIGGIHGKGIVCDVDFCRRPSLLFFNEYFWKYTVLTAGKKHYIHSESFPL